MENDKMINITCSVETIRFYKDGWGIILVSIDKIKSGTPEVDKNGILILKGNMPSPHVGSMYNVKALYSPDPKWGDQYEIVSIYTAIIFNDDDKTGQKKFLASIFTPLQVENMYNVLEDPFTVLKTEDSKQLVKVKGCGLKTAITWINRFKANYHLGKIFTELEDYNLTNKMIEKLVERYKSPDIVIEKVKTNPYVLCNEVNGIGWKKADQIALSGGMDPYSTIRISAFIIYYLNMQGENGCSWITPDELMGAIIQEIGEDVPDESIMESIYDLQEQLLLWWDDRKTQIGLSAYYLIEYGVAEELIRLRDADSCISYNDWKDWRDTIKHLEHQQGWRYTKEQLIGVQQALENNVILIQGGAGTGKSTLVKAFLEILRQYSYVQCALSGRAASRMTEITGEEGYTIHRLLGYPNKEEGSKQGFAYHDENPLTANIYIIDEISMVDAHLFYYLLRAIPSGSKVICLGDQGQLEAIGSGNIAHDMLHSPEIETAILTQIHRQAQDSAIITESIKIRTGEQIVPQDWTGVETRGVLQDLELECYSDASNTYYRIMSAFTEAMSTPDFDILETQILVPIKTRGFACAYELNNNIQEIYNPENINKVEYVGFLQGKPYILREGDKVINTRNNYSTTPPIFNGNLGIIKSIDYEEDTMTIDFWEIGEVVVEREDWGAIELAYAISVHKSQGSQWNNVILGFDFSAYSLLTRELVYTGITRAKKKCKLIAQTGALRMATGKQAISKKQTHLQQCLYNVAHPKLIF